jgi:prolyl-tRNA synthetase
MGMPYVLVVGKGLAEGVVEVRDRRAGERHDLAPEAAVCWLSDAVNAELRRGA